MGYMYAYSACLCCGNLFSYNPHRVPSSRAVTGEREPVCQSCMDMINTKRAAAGLAPFTILPGAYDPVEEN